MPIGARCFAYRRKLAGAALPPPSERGWNDAARRLTRYEGRIRFAVGTLSMVPMLIGDQGFKKSCFCKAILPPSMREYYMDDIKMDNAVSVCSVSPSRSCAGSVAASTARQATT